MVGKRWSCMMLHEMFLQPLQNMWDFMFHNYKLMFSHPLPYNLCVIKSTLCYSVNSVRMLADIIIAHPTQVDLMLHATIFHGLWQ
jgi:hypothetical protein